MISFGRNGPESPSLERCILLCYRTDGALRGTLRDPGRFFTRGRWITMNFISWSNRYRGSTY